MLLTLLYSECSTQHLVILGMWYGTYWYSLHLSIHHMYVLDPTIPRLLLMFPPTLQMGTITSSWPPSYIESNYDGW